MSAAPRRYFPRGNDSRADGEGEVSTHIVPFKQADTCTGHFENNAKNAALYKVWQWPWLLNYFDRCVKCHVWGYRVKKLGLPVKCGVLASGLRPQAGWRGQGHGVSPSRGNIKGVKNLNSTPGNSCHVSSVTHVVTHRVTLHQQPLEQKVKRWWDGGRGLSPHMGPPASWAGGACCLPLGTACSPPCVPPQQRPWAGSKATESLGIGIGFPLHGGKMRECEISIIGGVKAFPGAVKPQRRIDHGLGREPGGSPTERCCVKEKSCPSPGPIRVTMLLFLSCLQNLRLRKKKMREKGWESLEQEHAVGTNPFLHFKL